MARVATSATSVSVPATASSAPTTATTAPGGLAVVMPVQISVLAGAFTTVLLVGHVQTAPVPGIKSVIQTASFQVLPAVKQKKTNIQMKNKD